MRQPVCGRKGGDELDCPLCVSGRQVGILRVTAEGRDTCFTIRASAPGGLYRLYARGERRDLLLGVWEGGAMSRRFSREMTASAGRILGAEAYPVCRPEELWEPALPEQFPRWQVSGGLSRCRKNGRELALPFDDESPFPIPALFCLARIICVNGRRYAAFFFDREGRPGLPTDF